jgi:hypothetical protein
MEETEVTAGVAKIVMFPRIPSEKNNPERLKRVFPTASAVESEESKALMTGLGYLQVLERVMRRSLT